MKPIIGRIFLLLFILGVVPSAKGEEVKFEVSYEGGSDYEFFVAVGIDSAITSMKHAVKKDPENEELQFALAALYWEYEPPNAL